MSDVSGILVVGDVKLNTNDPYQSEALEQILLAAKVDSIDQIEPEPFRETMLMEAASWAFTRHFIQLVRIWRDKGQFGRDYPSGKGFTLTFKLDGSVSRADFDPGDGQ